MRHVRRRVGVALVLVVIVASSAVIAWPFVQGGPRSNATSPASTPPISVPAAAHATTATAPPVTTTAPPPTTTTTTVAPVAPGELSVVALQQRLLALGFWLARADGVFDNTTAHAVVAFQKANGLARDGVVGPLTRAALATAVRPTARSTHGHVVEIDLTRQLLLVVADGRVDAVFDTSTGRITGRTPTGEWRVEREIDGFHRSRLGLLYRPKYFHGGVAVHGFTSVPPYPASHGCVRVTYAAIDELWASDAMPVGTPVWVYR